MELFNLKLGFKPIILTTDLVSSIGGPLQIQRHPFVVHLKSVAFEATCFEGHYWYGVIIGSGRRKMESGRENGEGVVSGERGREKI